MMSARIALPPLEQRYDCHSCGHCCRNYTVPVTEEERARIEQQGWQNEPGFEAVALFARHAGRKDDVLSQREDGSCVFLSREGRCRIHEKFGGHAKPLACQMYPFVFNRVGNKVHVSLRFDCPSVAGSKGRTLEAQKKAIASLAAEVMASRSASKQAFRGRRTLPDEHLAEAAGTLERIVSNDALDLTRRVVACVSLAELLRACDLSTVEQIGKMREFLRLAGDVAVAEARAAAMERKPPGKLAAWFFRHALALYGDRERSRQTTLHRLRQALATMQGRGNTPAWDPSLPSVPFAKMEEPFGPPADAADELLTRHLRTKLAGMAFCGNAYYNFPFLEGLFALLLMYPITLWFARLLPPRRANRG